MKDLWDLPFAELSVLAGVLESNGSKLDDLTLTPDDFADPRNSSVYEAMLRLHAEGKPVDPVSVGLAAPDHDVFLWEIGDQAPQTANTGYHADVVREASVRRHVRAAGERITEWSKNLELPDLTEKSRKELDEAFGIQQRRIRYLRDSIHETISSIGKPTRSVPTPWRSLTEAIGGFRPGALYVVGARPGVGKTAVSLQCATALSRSGSVAYSSLEMPERELQLRLVSQGAGVAHTMLDSGKPLPAYAVEKVDQWLPHAPGSISFDDRGSVTMNDIRVSVRSVARDGNLSGVVVDYLQLLSGASGAKRLEVVTEASRQLKMLARDFDVPVIALSQLNRQSESRSDKRPAMSDLRESGSIEQDADCVFLLHRDMEPSAEASPQMDMLIAKNRHGSTGVLSFAWHGEFMSLTEGF